VAVYGSISSKDEDSIGASEEAILHAAADLEFNRGQSERLQVAFAHSWSGDCHHPHAGI